MAELTSKDKLVLAHLYETEDYTVLRKYLEQERLNIATKLVTWPADDSIQIAKFQGQAEALKMLHLNLKSIHKAQPKD